MSSKLGQRVIGLLMVLGLVGMALTFLIVTTQKYSPIRPELIPVALFGGAFIFLVLMVGPVGRAIAGLLNPAPEIDSAVTDRLAQRLMELEDRLLDGSVESDRLNEMESRLEFAERLLAKPLVDHATEIR